jgi:hypothetical protein
MKEESGSGQKADLTLSFTQQNISRRGVKERTEVDLTSNFLQQSIPRTGETSLKPGHAKKYQATRRYF